MTTGDGIFWAAIIYMAVSTFGYVLGFVINRFPNKYEKRLEILEETLRANGIFL